MPFDPTLSTNPDLRRKHAAEIAASEDHERLVRQQQTQQQREAEQAQREQERQQKEADRAALVNQNLATETKLRAEGRGQWTGADGVIRPSQTDEQWQAETAKKKQAADDKLRYQQEGRKFTTTADDRVIPLETDEVLAQRRQAEGEKMRAAALTKQMEALDAEREHGISVGGKRLLTDTGRKNLEKELRNARAAGVNALLPGLQGTAKQTDKAGFWDVVNNNPTPEAQAATERISRLQQPDADLDDSDLADLEKDPATAPVAQKLRTVRDLIARGDEAKTFHDDLSARRADLQLRRDNYPLWEQAQRQKLASMDPASLESHDADLGQRVTDFQTRAQALQAEAGQWERDAQSLTQKNTQMRSTGIPAGEMVTLSDGSQWHAPLAEQLMDLQARQQAGSADYAQRARMMEQEQTELQKEMNLRREAATTHLETAQTQQRTQRDALRFTPGYERSAAELDALDQEADSRTRVVADMYPEDSPQRQAALATIQQDVDQRRQQAQATGQQRAAAATAAYLGIQTRLREEPKLRAVAGDLFIAARRNLAQSLGVSEAEAGDLLEDQESQDWSTIQGKHGEAIPQGNAAQRFMTEAAGDKRQFRLLKNGGVVVNPQITDPAAYKAAVDAAPATPEAKAAAMSRQPDLRAKYGAQALETLNTIGDADWQSFQGRDDLRGVPPEEIAAQYADKLKSSTTAGGKVLRALFQSMAQGIDDIGAQGLGLLSGLTGSETLMQGAQALNERSALIQADKEMRGAAGNFALDTAGQFARMVPSVLPAGMGARAATTTLALFGRTALGARIIPALSAALRTAKTPAEAARAAQQMMQQAGLAGAAAAGGAQTYGAQITDIYTTLRQQHPEMDHSTALRQAQLPSLLSGAMTALLTVAGGSTGVEKLLTSPAATKEAFKKAYASRLQQAGAVGKAMLTGGLAELPEELSDEVFSTVATAVASGQSVPQALAQFAESLPELAGAILALGGAGEGVQAFRESTAGSPSNVVTPPAAPAVSPEMLAAAEAEIDAFAPEGVDPQSLAATQTTARTLLYIAQGDVASLPDSDLALVGVERTENGELKNLKTSADGKPPRVKIENGQPIITQPTLDALAQHLPSVRAAIPLSESDRRSQMTAANSEPSSANSEQQTSTLSPSAAAAGTAPDSPTGVERGPGSQASADARGVSAQGAAPVTDRDTGGEPQAGAEASLADAPADGSPESVRSQELATHLEMLGLPADQSRTAAQALVNRRGILGSSYLEHLTDKNFRDDIAALGITGSLNAQQSQTNPLKAAQDLQERATKLSGQKAGQKTEAKPSEPAKSSPPASKEADKSGQDSAVKDSLTTQSAVPPVISRTKPAEPKVPRGTWDTAEFLKARQDSMARIPVAQRRRFMKFVNAMDEVMTQMAPAFPGVRFTNVQKDGSLNYTGAGIYVGIQDGAPTGLDIDLAELFSNATHIEERDIHRFVRQTIKHELRHIAALRVIPQADAEALWDRLTPKLRNRVYASYFAADIHRAVTQAEGKARQLSTNDLLGIAQAHLAGSTGKYALPEANPFNMTHEFLRMLDEDAEFAGQTSEAMDADPGLGTAIVDFLKKVMQEIKRLLDTNLPADVRVQVNEMRALVEKARKQILADLPKRDATFKGSERPNQNLAQTEDTRRSVVSTGGIPAPSPPPTDFRPVLGHTSTAFTDGNDSIRYQWAVVDVNSLVISNQDDGRINPAYPQELQPRDRTSASSEAQVGDIAKNMNLDRLSTSNGVGDGAPIVGEDAVVESGNGRTMGSRRGYLNGGKPAQSYRDALIRRAKDFGLNAEQVEAVKNPVLIRLRLTPVDRVAFVLSANVSTIAPKREIEQAKIDSKQIVPDLFTTFVPTEDGDIFTPANTDFIRAFISSIVPPAERPALIDAKGNLTQTGLRRVRNALFVHAYGDSAETLNALARLTESIDAGGSHITNALVAAAPRFAEQNARIEAGALYPLSITKDIAWTVQKLQDLRTRGEKITDYLAQDGIPGIDDVPTGIQKELLQFLDANKTSPRQINAALSRYANAIDNAGDPKQTSLFGDEPRPTPEELWNLASADASGKPLSTTANNRQPSQTSPALAAATKVTDVPPAGRLAPDTALRLYRKLKDIEKKKGAPLDGTQLQTLQRAQRSLAAVFQLDYAHPRSAPFALETENSEPRTSNGPEQLRLFTGTKSTRDPRLVEQFGEDWPHGWDANGYPNPPRTLPADSPLLQPTHEKATGRLPAEHPLVTAGMLPAGKDIPRAALQSALVAYFFRGKTPVAAGRTPTVYATGGGGGAGKSTILKLLSRLGRLDTSNAVLVNADEIKELIPEYMEIKDAGDGRAAALVHEESSQVTKQLLSRLLDPARPRYDFTYDATLGHRASTLPLLTRFKQAGMKIHLIGVSIDPREAIIRAMLRGAGSGRWVPVQMLQDAHAGFNGAVKEYLTLADRADIYDNTPPDAHEIATKSGPNGPVVIANDEYWTILDRRASHEQSADSPAQNEGAADQSSGGTSRGEGAGRPPLRSPESQGQGDRGPGSEAVPASEVTPPLAKSRTTVDDGPDLFSFDFGKSNKGLNLTDLLTPVQRQKKQEQSEQLDLFSQRPTAPAPEPEPPEAETSPPANALNLAGDDYASRARSLANTVYSELTTDDQPLTWQHLFRLADQAFGGTQADGVYTPKDAYDAVEIAVNRWITERTRFDSTPVERDLDLERAAQAIRALKSLTARLPTQSKRTEEMDTFQQFSTVPALAYVANWAAKLSPSDLMLEPSAGTGGLAAFARAAGARVVANELSPRRASLLRATDIAERVFEENAEQINNILPPDIRPTVVVMNPPFSTSPTGTKTTDNATKHIESALARLPEGGRLVAIVGEGMAHDRPAFRAWWKKMQQKHHVRANIQVNGAEYAKYGTTWDNQLVVIDKVPPPQDATVLTGRVESIDELPAMLDSIRHDRPVIRASVPGSPRGGGSASDADTARGPRNEARAPRPDADAGPRGPGNPGGGVADAPQSGQQPSTGGADRAGVDSAPSGDTVTAGRPGGAPDGGNAAGRADESVAPTQQEVRTTEELTDAVYDSWSPRITFPGAKPPPTNLAESAAMAAVEPPAVTYRPSIPKSYYADPARGDFDQRLATHALESITLAGNAHQQTVQAAVMAPREKEDWMKRFGTEPPAQFRRGFFIGDGTGAGKGRQIAGIIFDNWNQGRKRAVWVSEPNLLPDARRDLNDVADLGDKLFAINDTKAGEKLARSQGVGFISYSTLRSREQKPAPGKLPKSRVDQIVEWLGADFDGVIAFDEAHNMGSAMEMKGNRGNKEASQQALAGLELQQRLPNARVLYLSATGATEVSNLAFAERLGLWGPGTPFRDRARFVSQISAGGVAAMELIAQNLKAMGLYVARSISWHDVSYDRASHLLTPEQRQIYDDLAEAWQTALNNMDAAMKITGITTTDPETGNEKTSNGAAKSAIRSKFWSGHQRFFNQLITAMKMPTVTTAIERELAAGHSIVIQLVNTQASSLGRAINKAAQDAAENSEEIDLENLDLSPRDQLLQMVENVFPVIQMEEFTTVDSEGNSRTGTRPALDSKGNPIINQEAVAMRDALLDKLASTRVPAGPLEILMDHFGVDNVAEVTGREKRVVWKKDKDGRMVRTIEKRTTEHGKREVTDFQNGDRRILVFSKAGGTGRSFHADRRAKNQQKRVHILLQPGWQASAAVQGFGRTHRNNQVLPPHYLLAETDIVGEKRFMSSIARRLDQLGALTKGQRQTGSQGFFQARDNLESLEAKAALDGFYTRVLSGREPRISPDVLEQQMGLKLRDKEGVAVQDKPPITQFLNRLLSLKLDLQQAVFEAFSAELDAIIETKLSAGTLDQGLENVTALSTVVNERQTVYEDPQSGAKAELVSLTLTQPTKRMPFAAVSELARQYDAFPWVRNKRTGKLFAITGKRNVTEQNGSIDTVHRIVGVTNNSWVSSEALGRLYERVPEEARSPAMREEWQRQYDDAPGTKDETMQVLTGTMLPIWDKIPGQPRIVRLQTQDGRRMIGRDIPEDMAASMVKDLTGRTTSLTPAQAIDAVDKGQRIRLSNGWTLKTARLSGETRYEIIGPSFPDHTLLDAAGVIKERIQFNMRYFLPASKAEQTLTRVLDSFRATLEPESTRGLAKGTSSTAPETTANDRQQPQTTVNGSTLASASKSGYTPGDDADSAGNRLDNRTSGVSHIHGSRVTAEQGQTIRDVHFARLTSGSLRQDSAFARPGFDWRPGPATAQKLSQAFGVPLLTESQEASIRALPVNDDGVESMVYLDRENGVIYKRLQDWAGNPSGGAWAMAGLTPDGLLDWSYQPADNPRQTGIRLAVLTDMGGTPTEVAAIGPEGHIFLKQPLSPNPRIIQSAPDSLTNAEDMAGMVTAPWNRVDPSKARASIVTVRGKPWLALDLSDSNFIGDNDGNARVNDPIIGHLTLSVSNAAGLQEAVKASAQQAARLGDRANRLFKSSSSAPETTVNNGQPSSTTANGLSPLASLGWNHLDRMLSGKLAALVRWTDGRTGVSQTVAKWQGHDNPNLFNKAVHFVKGQLFPDSILPREVAAARREMDIKASVGAQKAMDLVRALSGTPKFSDIAYPPEFAQNPVWRKRLYAAMTGEEPMSALPQPLQDLAKRLREMLLTIGREAVKQGRMSSDTFALLEESYMPHYYEEDVEAERSLVKRFRLGLRDILAQRTTAWHIVDLQQKDSTGEHAIVNWDKGKWRFRNKEHRDAFFEDFILTQALDRLRKFGSRNTRQLTLADLRAPAKLDAETRGRLQEITRTLRQRFKREAPLSLAEREKAGLIMDPVFAIARYAAQMIHDNSTAEFFNFVASKPEWVSDVQIQNFTEIPDNPRFGRLAGKFVQNDIAAQLLEMVEAPNTALKVYDTILGWWKTGKTVLNPGTHVRNVLGNLFFSQLAGNSVWNPGNLPYYRQAIEALRNGGPALQEAYEQGVLGADFVSAELRQQLRALLPDPATIQPGNEAATGRLMSIGKSVGQFLGSNAGKAYDKVAALYQAEDEVFKLAAYLKARAVFSEQQRSTTVNNSKPPQTLAAEHVRQWFPFFDNGSSTTLRTLGRTAMPFLGFYRESIRIFGEALKHRPIALAAGLSVPSLITFLAAAALGLDDDELEQVEKDMRGRAGKLLGPTPLGGRPLFSMLLPVRSGSGALQQFDISAVHPFVDFLGNRVETDGSEDWWQQTLRSLVAAGPVGSLLYSQMTGRDAFGDRTFVENNMTGGEKLGARLDNFAKTVLPPLAPGGTGFQTLMHSGERSTNKTLEVRDPGQAALRTLVGLDVRNATPDLYRIADDWRKAQGLPTSDGMDYGTTPTSRARTALFTQLAQDEPNQTAITNILTRLKEMGSPVSTPQDIQKLLFYRNPLMIIRGQENQQRFRASLTGLERETLETALQEFERIKARARQFIR